VTRDRVLAWIEEADARSRQHCPDINKRGQVVGVSTATGEQHAFLWGAARWSTWEHSPAGPNSAIGTGGAGRSQARASTSEGSVTLMLPCIEWDGHRPRPP
jgi:probable HAF family extracellular repeat protein